MSLAVVGTDTGVGKTLVSALVLLRYRHLAPRYWKPIATGADEESDRATIRSLAGAAATALPEVYALRAPRSPHHAARLEGTAIDPGRVIAAWTGIAAGPVIVEGAGGLLVPLTDDGDLLVDLFASLAVPCLLVARAGLGTINHTLLSLEALRVRGMEVAGVVLSGPEDEDNARTIHRLGGVSWVEQVGHLESTSPGILTAAAKAFDRGGRLAVSLGGGTE